ncbi:MAG: glycosyltransferase [Candidatus Dormibacter sp.]|uniref:glycosyltransferase n=1 Tax=Candidatus Dormibacter sp. TaxID=2973982 RepID=UPI002684D94B
MVGPCDWDPPAPAPRWLEEITGPIVLVTTSSEFQDDGRLVLAALEALAAEPFTVVATMPAGDPTRLAVPANARVERFISHGAVLDRAVCAVTHGGMGATQKALARGVPVCAVPFGAISSRSRGGWTLPAPVHDYRPSDSPPTACDAKSWKPSVRRTEPNGLPTGSRRPGGREQPPTPSSSS